jgi:hypothetical protein
MQKKQNKKFTKRKLVIILLCLLAAVVSAAVILIGYNRKNPGLPGTMPAEPVLTLPPNNGTVNIEPPVESPPEQPPLPEPPPAIPTPAVQPPPPKQLEWEEPATEWVAGNLTRLAREADRTVTDTSPPRNQNFTISRLAADGSIRFTWAGAADEYRFALYRNDEMEIIPPVTVTEPSYTFTDAGILQEGTYVWHVYEKNRRGEWDLPSTVSTLYVLSKMPEN